MVKNWIKGIDYPEWGDNTAYLTTMSNGYVKDNETPKNVYLRIAKTASEHLNRPDLEERIFNAIWNNWLCPSTPIMANFGRDKGLPISCFGSHIPDDLGEIFRKVREVALMNKYGGGTSGNFTPVRPAGSPISAGGTSDGIVPFLQVFDSTKEASKQLPVRRGAFAAYLDIEHRDFWDFIKINDNEGSDKNRTYMSIQNAVNISDAFMNDLTNENLEKIKQVVRSRKKKGVPYIMFKDNVNNQRWWKDILPHLIVNHSNLCIEIALPNDANHSFVCCLLSVNLLKYDEWKDTDVIELGIYLLDAVITEFNKKASKIDGLEDAVRFAEKSRALGLGVLGWHSFLQSKDLPFNSWSSSYWNKTIFKQIHDQALLATQKLAKEYGEPEWLKGTGRRNLTTTAIAPTVSNSQYSNCLIGNDLSQGIEPLDSNYFSNGTAKGLFFVKNTFLTKKLIELNKNTPEVWDSILKRKGSVQHLDFLSKDDKEVFLTWREINQQGIIEQAAERQKYIEQGQSLNLAFTPDVPERYVLELIKLAHKLGLKSLYYHRSESGITAQTIDNLSKQEYKIEECLSCEG